MVKHFLITRPVHDRETSYLYSFSKGIVKIAKSDRGIHVTDLPGKNANRANLEASLEAVCPRLIFLNGHGDKNTVWGHNDEIIFDEENVALAKNNIVYALACNSLIGLGKFAVKKKGVEAYIGYADEFMWIGEPSRSSSVDKDKSAAPFRRACHVLINSLLSGESVGMAIKHTQKMYKKLIKTYGTSEDDYGDAPLIGLALSWDLFFLGMEGNPQAAF